jgi:hypothetical protein
MKKYNKILLISTARNMVASAAFFAALFSVNLAMATPSSSVNLTAATPSSSLDTTSNKDKMMVHKKFMHNHNLGLMQNKNLSTQDAATIIKACLLEENRKYYSITDIKPMAANKDNVQRYVITIADPKGNPASTIVFNSANGHFYPMKIIK